MNSPFAVSNAYAPGSTWKVLLQGTPVIGGRISAAGTLALIVIIQSSASAPS